MVPSACWPDFSGGSNKHRALIIFDPHAPRKWHKPHLARDGTLRMASSCVPAFCMNPRLVSVVPLREQSRTGGCRVETGCPAALRRRTRTKTGKFHNCARLRLAGRERVWSRLRLGSRCRGEVVGHGSCQLLILLLCELGAAHQVQYLIAVFVSLDGLRLLHQGRKGEAGAA